MAETISGQLPQYMLERQRSWLQPDNSTSQIILQTMEMQARNRLQSNEQELRRQSQMLEFQKFQSEQEDRMLTTLEKRAVLADTLKMRHAQVKYAQGDRTAVPELTTWQGNRNWALWKSHHDLEATEVAEFTTFQEQLSKLDGFGIAAVRSVGQFGKGSITPAHYVKLGSEQKRVREELLRSKSETRVVEVEGQKYLQNLSTGGLHSIPKDWQGEGVPALPIVDEEGNVVAHGVQNSRGGVTVLRQVQQKRHSLQSTLQRAEAELAAARVDSARKDELPGLLEKIKSLKKSIATDGLQQAPAAPAASDNYLRYDPLTDTLK